MNNERIFKSIVIDIKKAKIMKITVDV